MFEKPHLVLLKVINFESQEKTRSMCNFGKVVLPRLCCKKRNKIKTQCKEGNPKSKILLMNIIAQAIYKLGNVDQSLIEAVLPVARNMFHVEFQESFCSRATLGVLNLSIL